MATTSVPPVVGARPVTTANPLREGLRLERMPEPCTMVIFGATGDLTARKLGPALYNLSLGGFLPGEFTVVGVARRPWDDRQFRARLLEGINRHSRNRPVKDSVWSSFSEAIYYHQGEFTDPEAYRELARKLDMIDRDRGTAGNRLFYLAVPPTLYPTIAHHLGEVGLAATGAGRPSGARQGWSRLIVEKPFGSDLQSARSLNRELTEVFEESQLFRIDHYLGKETVQKMVVFRFGKDIF